MYTCVWLKQLTGGENIFNPKLFSYNHEKYYTHKKLELYGDKINRGIICNALYFITMFL